MQANVLKDKELVAEKQSERAGAEGGLKNRVISLIYGNYVAGNIGDRIPCATLAERVIGFMERYGGCRHE
jgi:hypothetical protein